MIFNCCYHDVIKMKNVLLAYKIDEDFLSSGKQNYSMIPYNIPDECNYNIRVAKTMKRRLKEDPCFCFRIEE